MSRFFERVPYVEWVGDCNAGYSPSQIRGCMLVKTGNGEVHSGVGENYRNDKVRFLI
jgi:hypothetical protein